MERLIDNALIYGSMMTVDAPHMIERYNWALTEFGLPKTERDSFVVDAAGYSPEIAEDLGDEDYLDPGGINRRFIILSPEQETLPVISSNFSTTAELMSAFYRTNSESLKILTLKDVVLGEIEDSTYRVNDISDILSIRQVEFKLKTSQRLIEKARRLNMLIDRFYTSADGWKDDDLLHEILDLSRICGDTRYNAILPRHTLFNLKSFWTSHFGGIFVFNEGQGEATVIGPGGSNTMPAKTPGMKRFIAIDDAEAVHAFLDETGRLEPFNQAWLEKTDLIASRSDILVRTAMLEDDPDLDVVSLSEVAVKNWINGHIDRLYTDGSFPFFNKLQKKLRNRAYVDLYGVDARHVLQVVRATPGHRDQVLVNRLLTHYAPYDFLSRFILDKQAFYDAYRTWSDRHQEYAVETIKRFYLPDKQRVWDLMFEDTEN